MNSHRVRGKAKTSTVQLDRRAMLALGFGAAAVALLAGPQCEASAAKVNLEGGLAIQGYDPVAYFNDRTAVAGNPALTARYAGATYRFSSQTNRDKFKAHPAKYAPQYGGYSAYAVAQGYTAPIDPQAFTVHNDRLYLNFSKGIRSRWARDIEGNIAKADVNWPKLLDG